MNVMITLIPVIEKQYVLIQLDHMNVHADEATKGMESSAEVGAM